MYEQLYADYISLGSGEVTQEGFINVHCPFHDDRHASAGVSVQTGVFNCYNCGSFSAAQFISKISNISIDAAREIVEDFRINNNLIEKHDTFVKKQPRSTPKFQRLYKLSQELMDSSKLVVMEYMESRQVTFQTLVDLGVGFLPAEETSWKRDSIVFPYLLDGKCVGIRYRDILGNKGGEENCHFTLWGIDELEKEQDVVILLEGETDRIKTYECIKGKYTTVSAPTATFMKEWAREFESVRQVIMLPQDDDASTKMIEKATQALGNKLTVVHTPWSKREFGKDVCDWVKHRQDEDLLNLIESFVTPKWRRVMSGHDLEEAAGIEQQWIIKGLLARRQAVMIGGQAKSMKTWFALNMIRCMIDAGSNLAGIPELESTYDIKNIMFIEEEGNLEELYSRAKSVLQDLPEWKDKTFWMHHMGLKLDSPDWLQTLIKYVKEYDLDVMFIDPFQRTHSADENDATAIGKVWNTLDSLLSMFPNLSIIVLHHFNKIGDIAEGFNAFRGSSRLAGEVDLGVFIEKRPPSEASGIKVKFEGRSIPQITTADGKDIFRLAFNDGIFTLDSGRVHIGKADALIAELKERNNEWPIKDAAQFFGVSVDTVRNWVKKSDILYTTAPAPGRPTAIKLKETEND